MKCARIHIVQGQYATASGPDAIISTLLGSCVAVCLWDEDLGIGGMNHMLLAKSSAGDHARTLSGLQAMELLINDLLKQGAMRNRLKAKAFGGASMVEGLSDVGQQNAEFTEHFLAQEGIPLTTASFGGTQARSVRFWPANGRALQKLTNANVDEVKAPAAAAQDVELF
ncbi:MAG: chemotaxis protein CheD [Pseudomonadota bacterium]